MCDNNSCVGCKNPYTYEDVEKIANFLRSKVDIKPRIGLVCGTGLGGIPALMTDTVTFPYGEIPNFPVSTVAGHDGKLIIGYLSGTPIVCMQGRFHFFEGYPLWKVVLPIRVMKILGISILVLSNAAGGINSSYSIGDIMFLKDHINFVALGGHNPLQGDNEEKFGPRFVAINDSYDREILKLAKNTAKELGMKGVQEGVYCCIGGPSFETVAELRALKMLGGDAVGMSTVHEVITAMHCGIKCFAFSLITNKCPMEYDGKNTPNHEEILDVGKERQDDVRKFVERLFKNLAQFKVK
ncbi:purine nucleoside phosphorylase-like [Zophobas morio]|uniref:purine nucleoside phosphorylase-like n=1 Tax=Zophobas morio TaxID=2755281 RepID=UPI003083EA21